MLIPAPVYIIFVLQVFINSTRVATFSVITSSESVGWKVNYFKYLCERELLALIWDIWRGHLRISDCGNKEKSIVQSNGRGKESHAEINMPAILKRMTNLVRVSFVFPFRLIPACYFLIPIILLHVSHRSRPSRHFGGELSWEAIRIRRKANTTQWKMTKFCQKKSIKQFWKSLGRIESKEEENWTVVLCDKR